MPRQQLQSMLLMSMKDPEITWRELAEIPESTWKSCLDQAQWERLCRKFQKLREAGNNNL
jgi:hypothetical protein